MLIGSSCRVDEYEALSSSGYDYAEFPCRAVCEMNERAFKDLCKHVEIVGFPVLGMNLYCPPEIVIAGTGYCPETIRAYARKAAERANYLGVQTVGIGSPKSRIIPTGFNFSTAKEQITEFLRITANEFSVFNIQVTLEPLATFYCNFINSFKEAYEIVTMADVDNLGILVDFYNMEHFDEGDMGFESLSNLINHAHISDDDGSPTLRSYMKPENYSIHENRIHQLIDSGYKGNLTIEIDIPYDNERAYENLRFIKQIIPKTKQKD